MSDTASTGERISPSGVVPSIPVSHVQVHEDRPPVGTPTVISTARPATQPPRRRVFLRMELPPELDTELQEMVQRVGEGGYSKMMRQALGLLKIALDARDENKRLVVVDDRDNSEQEITL